MKEDVLEQLVDDYLKLKGYFTRHNIKFAPRKGEAGYNSRSDSVASDIDVLGFNPLLRGSDRVWAVSCKSWQGGFDASWWAENARKDTKAGNKPAWKHFRELVRPKWTNAFLREMKALTGGITFTYVTAVTRLRGERGDWENRREHKQAIGGNSIRIITLEEIVKEVREMTTTTPAPSEIGRFVQLLKSAKLL